jgi:hypothetical protein
MSGQRTLPMTGLSRERARAFVGTPEEQAIWASVLALGDRARRPPQTPVSASAAPQATITQETGQRRNATGPQRAPNMVEAARMA